MNHKLLAALMASAGLLTACGGGSSSTDATTTPVTTPTTPVASTSAKVTLTGIAAKGLMANADVDVLAVNSDGSVSTTVLAHTTTDSKGIYSLSFDGTQGQPVVIKVSAKADGTTTHADEVSGAPQALPAGFAMRSLLVPASTGTVTTSASVTPFSELAVAAAAKAGGGITAANAKQAVSTVTQLLGFDPSKVAATTVAAATSNDEKALALLLTAVSQMASTSALGCSTGSAGDKTKCVVDTLASAASTSSLKLATSGGVDVSAALGSAVTSVVADSSLSGSVSSSVVAIVNANLACSASSCTAAPSSGGSTTTDATAVAIAAAKGLIAEIKSDWSAMFSTGGTSSIAGGAVNQEGFAYKTALDGVHVPMEMLAKDLGTLLMAVDYYNDAKGGRVTSFANGRGRGDGSLVAGNGSVPDSNTTPAGCTLYQDSATTVVATAAANVNFIGCGARYYVSRTVNGNTTVTTEWRHGFTITPAVDGSFGYTTRARRRVTTCVAGSCSTTTNEALQTDGSGVAIPAFAGTLTPTLSGSYGDITSFSLSGELPAAFKPGSTTLEGYKHVVTMSGTQASPGIGAVTSTLQGSVVAKDSAGATTGTVTVKPGSSMAQTPVGVDAAGNDVSPSSSASLRVRGGTLSALTLDLAYTTARAEFEGVLSATDSVWDASGTQLRPTKASLSGALRNIASSGVTTEFFKGVFTASTTGWAGFNKLQAESSSNAYTLNLGFTGTITAANRPTLELTMATGWGHDGGNNGGGTALPMALQYRTLVAGAPKLVVKVAAERVNGSTSGNNGDVSRFTLTEASAGLSMAWNAGASSADLYHDSTKIGSFDSAAGLLTFSDKSFISVDIGL